MPEGHSVRRLANTFEEFFVGERLEVTSPQGRFAAGAAILNGRVMTGVFSYGKHLFMRFDDLWLHTHLGLYGAWRFHADEGVAIEESIGAPRIDSGVLPPLVDEAEVQGEVGDGRSGDADSQDSEDEQAAHLEEASWDAPDPVGAVRVRLEAPRVAADLSGPIICEVLDTGHVEQVLDKLGPDPLDHQTDPDLLRQEFVKRVRASKRTVGDLVMDQGVSAGVGNIYRAEALFRQGISPNRRGSNVSEERLGYLWDDFVDLLEVGVETGDILTLEDEDAPADEDSEDAPKHYVYRREGESCLRCGDPIKHKEMSGRNLYWCSTCQR